MKKKGDPEEHVRRIVLQHGGDADSLIQHHICTPTDPSFDRKNPRLHEYTGPGGLRQLVGRLAKQYEFVLVSADPDTPMDLRLTGVILSGSADSDVDRSAAKQVSHLLGKEGILPADAKIICGENELPPWTVTCWDSTVEVDYSPTKGVTIRKQSMFAFPELAEAIRKLMDRSGPKGIFVVLDTDDIEDDGELLVELHFDSGAE